MSPGPNTSKPHPQHKVYPYYAETDHLPIDNNPVENSINPSHYGKRILFSGSEQAG
jgi:hypothetical protein